MKARKTAVSIPDDIFETADAVAKRLGLSRSALYAKALAEFLARHGGDDVTKALDRVYAKTPSSMDRGLLRAQAASLPREKW